MSICSIKKKKIDIHYPDRQVIALLMHNDFAPEFIRTLNKFGVKALENFDPLIPDNLRDPTYAELPVDERQELAKAYHNGRLLRALALIRIPVRYAVARQFTSTGWITVDQLRDVLATRHTSTSSSRRQPEGDMADIFQQHTTATEQDEIMSNQSNSLSLMLDDERTFDKQTNYE